MSQYKCAKCKRELEADEAYEYRGAYSCGEHFDEVIQNRDSERQNIIREETRKTEVFKGLDLSDSPIGKANRSILKPQIEIASQESDRLKRFENRTKK